MIKTPFALGQLWPVYTCLFSWAFSGTSNGNDNPGKQLNPSEALSVQQAIEIIKTSGMDDGNSQNFRVNRAIQHLVSTFNGFMHSRLRASGINNELDREELIQDTWKGILRNIHRLKWQGDAKFEHYVARTLRRKAIDFFRKHRNDPHVLDFDVSQLEEPDPKSVPGCGRDSMAHVVQDDQPSYCMNPEQKLLETEERLEFLEFVTYLRKACLGLFPLGCRERQVIEALFNGLDNQAIASKLGTTDTAVRVAKSKALCKIRQTLLRRPKDPA